MKPFKSIREGNSVEPGVSEINDVPEDPLSYVEIKPKKAKVVKEASELGDLAHQTTLKHRFLVTYSDPNHTMVSKRKEHQQKHVLVPSTKDGQTVYTGDAEPLVKKYMKKQGYKVHNVEHIGMVSKKVNEEWVQTGKTATHTSGEKTFEWAKVDDKGNRTGERHYRNASGKVMGEEKEMQDKEQKENTPQDKARAIQRAMNATPKKPAGEYERKVSSYLKKKYNESIDLNAIWESIKPVVEEIKTTHEDPLVTTRDAEGHIHTHANLSVANAIHGTDVKHQAIHSGRPVKAGKFTFELSKHHEKALKESASFDPVAHKKELDRLITKHMNAHAETTRLIKAKASQEDINKAQERNNAIKAEIRAHKDKVPAGPAPKPGSAAHYYASKKPGEYTGD